ERRSKVIARTRIVVVLSVVTLLGTGARGSDLSAFLAKLPAATAPVLNQDFATLLSTMPQACLERPQAQPSGRGYLWEATYRPPDDYQKNLAFYGCFDWHSSVNSTWTLVKLLKSYPELPEQSASLTRKLLNEHLGASNLNGELAYLKTAGAFERPYGYAWILKVAAELSEWKDPDAQKWSTNFTPLATWSAAEMATFLTELQTPNRTGVHPNTAFDMFMMLDYVDTMKDENLRKAIVDTSDRFYAKDKSCTTKNEPAGSDFLSPCLSEAALMGRLAPRE